MRHAATTYLVTLALAVSACGDAPETPVEPADDVEWMMVNAPNYLDDTEWRRAELEASLWAPDLPYASKRLAAYGLGERGWDLLPVMPAVVQPVSPETANEPFEGTEIEIGETPTTREEWLALGEEVFWKFPMRRDAYLDWVAERPELWEELGLEANDDGTLRGVVRYRDARGTTRTAITCGMCHGDQGVGGATNEELDLGLGRALFSEARGGTAPEFREWGPGRIDVTDDGVTDALAIPNLWGANEQSYLNSSGAVKVASPASLAIRFETQYIEGHSYESRPDRRLTWALALYVVSLEAPETGIEPDPRGLEVFEANCASCHQPDQGWSGGLVPAEALNSDPTAAMSVYRGTRHYKIPSLLGVSQGGPYLHDSSARTLDELLEMGHPTGAALDADDRNHLIDYLNTL